MVATFHWKDVVLTLEIPETQAFRHSHFILFLGTLSLLNGRCPHLYRQGAHLFIHSLRISRNRHTAHANPPFTKKGTFLIDQGPSVLWSAKQEQQLIQVNKACLHVSLPSEGTSDFYMIHPSDKTCRPSQEKNTIENTCEAVCIQEFSALNSTVPLNATCFSLDSPSFNTNFCAQVYNVHIYLSLKFEENWAR